MDWIHQLLLLVVKMQRFYLFLAFSFGTTLISAVQSNNKNALEVCVNQYAVGFADPRYQKMDDIELHCLLGKVGNHFSIERLACCLR